MVIGNGNIFRARFCPPKTNSPLVVDTNAVLAGPLATEFLESVPRRDPQIEKVLGGIEYHEFSQCEPLYIGMKFAHTFPMPDPFGIFIGKRLQHASSITPRVINATRYILERVAVDVCLAGDETDALVQAVCSLA